MSISRRYIFLVIASCLLVGPGLVYGAVLPLFTETIDPAVWNNHIDANTPSNGNIVVSAPTIFGTGDALRMFDFSTTDKPELQGELEAGLSIASPLLEPFRIDFMSADQSVNSSSKAIRFRMANSGDSITSESRVAFSLSWQADAEFTAKYSGISDGDPNDVDTISSLPLAGAHSISMIANGAVAGTYAYNVFGVNRTLDPLHYDIYIDGILLNDSVHTDFANGMKFTLEKSIADYDPTLGLGRFGILGSSNSDVDPDVLYDDIFIKTGSNIPEPATLSLLLGAFALLSVLRGRRR